MCIYIKIDMHAMGNLGILNKRPPLPVANLPAPMSGSSGGAVVLVAGEGRGRELPVKAGDLLHVCLGCPQLQGA